MSVRSVWYWVSAGVVGASVALMKHWWTRKAYELGYEEGWQDCEEGLSKLSTQPGQVFEVRNAQLFGRLFRKKRGDEAEIEMSEIKPTHFQLPYSRHEGWDLLPVPMLMAQSLNCGAVIRHQKSGACFIVRAVPEWVSLAVEPWGEKPDTAMERGDYMAMLGVEKDETEIDEAHG